VRVERPWGYYEVLELREFFQIKLLVVNSGKRLSLQSHNFRSEHWHVLSGKGFVTVGSEIQEVGPEDSISIPVGVKHRVAAGEGDSLTFIEIQTGTSFDEDDIFRYEDDFGRQDK
jgi:mannose-6-phosphate isomerase-like protein (cupin superfamily)